MAEQDSFDALKRAQRKTIRLDPNLYWQTGARAFVTIAVQSRQPVFLNHALSEECVVTLKEQANHDGVSVIAYCFMPDHAHLLLQIDGAKGVVGFVRAFKGRTTRLAWSHGVDRILWQRSFYDHLLRESEDVSKHIRYILENPIRRGLVENWRDYPFSGSLTVDLADDSIWDR